MPRRIEFKAAWRPIDALHPTLVIVETILTIIYDFVKSLDLLLLVFQKIAANLEFMLQLLLLQSEVLNISFIFTLEFLQFLLKLQL
jgi:hypothetical protein